jgi:hypothetical protein
MKKTKILILLLIGFTFQLHAQTEVKDTTKRKASMGIQIANDFCFLTFPKHDEYDAGLMDEDLTNYTEDLDCGATEFYADKLKWSNTFWVRTDVWATIPVTPSTTMYGLIALRLLNLDSGKPDDFSYTLLNAEIEQKLSDRTRFRLGRLVAKYSESQYFGRVLIGRSDAHTFGRIPLVNDAAEFTMDYKDKKIKSNFAVGVKPYYKPTLDFYSAYLVNQFALPVKEKKEIKFNLIYNFCKSLEEDLVPDFPITENDRYFHAVETELAFVNNEKYSIFVNAGGYLNYIGIAPHFSGPRDILKGQEPLVDDPKKSFNQSLMVSNGIIFHPAKICKKLWFWHTAGFEAEYLGLGREDLKTYNTYFNQKFKFGRIVIDYALTLNLVRFAETKSIMGSDNKSVIIAVDGFNNIVHYFRVSVMFGSLERM